MKLSKYMDAVDRAYGELAAPALERRLTELAEAAADEYGRESAEYAAMRSELGGFYRGQARLEASEAELSAALAILKTAVGADSPDYATALNNLAGTHRRMGDYERAEAEFAEALEIYEHTVGKGHILYASGLNNLSLLCLDRNDLSGAADYLKKSSEILSALPECQDELAASLCNLGALDLRLGRAEDGIPLLQRAIALFEGPLGIDTPHYHAALTTLGLCRRSIGDLFGARDALERAAAAAKALYGESHVEYLGIMQCLSATEKMTGETNEGT